MKGGRGFILPILKNNSAARLIEEQIRLHGPMSFARYVELALYHPAYGYYAKTPHPRGRGGDYFTAMQSGGVVPLVMADVLAAMKEELGTDHFHVVEFGSGSGEFLESVLKDFERRKIHRGFHFWAVEKSPRSRELLVRRLSRFRRCAVVPDLEDIPYMGGLEGCFFSNELFDALPFHRVRRRGTGWAEIGVDVQNGSFIEIERSPEAPDLIKLLESWPPLEWIDGQEIEARPGAGSLLASWGSQLLRGYVVTFDYGYPRSDLAHPIRKDGTWRCFSRHVMNTSPFERIGRQDITAHVDFTQLAHAAEDEDLAPALFCSQGIFLSHAGQRRIQEMLDSHASSPHPKLVGSLHQLLRPDAMGEKFHVLVHRKNASLPPQLADIPNRLRRLD